MCVAECQIVRKTLRSIGRKEEQNASVIIVNLRTARAEKNDKIAEDVAWIRNSPVRESATAESIAYGGTPISSRNARGIKTRLAS